METREEWESTLRIIDFLLHVTQSGVHSLHGKRDIMSKRVLQRPADLWEATHFSETLTEKENGQTPLLPGKTEQKAL